MENSSKNIVYSQKFFDVEEEHIVLPGGKKRVYSTVRRKPISVIFPLLENYDLYLISQYRHLFKKNILEAIAGHADGKETPIDTAKRELVEETGLSAKKWDKIIEFNASASVIDSYTTVFLARDIMEGLPSPEEDEDIKLVRVPLKEALDKVLSGEITTASTIIGILLLDKMYREKRL